ncbi:MAG: hypothetical protein AB1894_17555 [Chloroflexota bacterium]
MAINPLLMRELETLPPERQVDVLAFVRYLKYSLPDDETLERNFLSALDKAQALAQERGISEQDIAQEIRSVRSRK